MVETSAQPDSREKTEWVVGLLGRALVARATDRTPRTVDRWLISPTGASATTMPVIDELYTIGQKLEAYRASRPNINPRLFKTFMVTSCPYLGGESPIDTVASIDLGVENVVSPVQRAVAQFLET